MGEGLAKSADHIAIKLERIWESCASGGDRANPELTYTQHVFPRPCLVSPGGSRWSHPA